ncbi:histone-lysine N-methyltransferase SETMAR [Plakobranchus ocellatus]|uniref:Histone-lysine N-methyltransferase SETMAR n=1 Tax=Plakobranchus ocellatus TaxID=259542 RepID=A0AAV4ARR3_9GAST|nr:histone-lysine N-methyltransferase SETMAR [Plakobranchus ocellatus]
MSRSRVYQWCTWFGEGRTSLGDEPKSGRLKISTNEENTTRIDELIRCDRRMKIREIALKLEIPKSTVDEIVHDTLGYRRVSARWVPKMLTEDHKLQRSDRSSIRPGLIADSTPTFKACIASDNQSRFLERYRRECIVNLSDAPLNILD